MSGIAIGDHALLSDCRSSALVAGGSVEWLCFPRFDSSPVFARLLDDRAGHFMLRPADLSATARRRYLPQGLVLETTWTCDTGELVVLDAMALGEHERGHQLGRSSPGVLLRSAHCTAGSVQLVWEYAPRPEFGLIYPQLSAVEGGVISDGGATVMLLSTDALWTVQASTVNGTGRLAEGERLAWALEQTDAWGDSPGRWDPRRIHTRLGETEKAWQSWSQLHQHYEGPLRSLVYQSGVVLQGLSYARSGALIAAATTSLPEGVGSGRTWDYRFSWVRDASMTMRGLWVAACPDEAAGFFTFLARAAATALDRDLHLPIMFGVGGERDLSEREMPHLSGWRDSAPVRSGNGAWNQIQLDVYGALLDAAFVLREQLGELDAPTRKFLTAAVEAAASRWQDEDQGIWEIRGPARPYLHSKLMCWVALDRGVQLADQLGATEAVGRWSAVREQIREAICEHGWNPDVGAFTQSFGSSELDASALLVALVGFLPGDDPRVASTVDAVRKGLSDPHGLIYRYRADDGMSGDEGPFLLCTFWLAEALAAIGRVGPAEQVLRLAASYANDVGLLAEQVDPASGELLGNFPQAFSHLGLVLAAQAVADAQGAGAAAPAPRAADGA